MNKLLSRPRDSLPIRPRSPRLACMAVALAVGARLLFPATALAQEGGCSLSSITVTFGTINPLYTGTVYTSGTASLTCTGLGANRTVAACLAIGAGSASGSTSAARVLSASGTLTHIPITITSAPGSGTQIGTGTPYPKEGPVIFATNASGQGSTTFPVTVALTGPLSVVPATYTNTFSSSNFHATYHTPSVSSCSSVTSNASGGQMIVQAVVVAGCSVTATPLNFGSTSNLGSPLAATSTILLNCTQGVTATIGLDNGQNGTGPTSRLISSGTQSAQYGIYQDAAHTLPWGQTGGVDTRSLVMSGTSATVTAFGVVPTQTTPPAGTYTDIVNVNVVY